MARTPAPYAKFHDEPSIIVDPSLYLPQRRCLLQVVCDTFLDVTRAVLVIAVAGVTVFSVVHVLRCRSLTARLPAPVPDVVQLREPSPVGLQFASADSVAPGLLEQELIAAQAGGAIEQLREPELDLEPRFRQARFRAATMASSTPPSRRALQVVIDVRTGYRMLAQKRFDEAERAFLDALALRTGQPAALAGLARVHLARGDVEQALSLAQRAVANAPYQASYHRALADVLRVSGDVEAADAQYELASRLSPKPAIAARGPLPANPF